MGVYDVAIVGCGPVGEVLSIVLAQHGVRSVAIEREHSIFSTPRAVALDDEVMRICQSLGLADQMSSVLSRMTAALFYNEAGQRLGGGDMGERTDQQWGETYLFHQPHVEEVLHARMAELGAEVRYGTEVTAIEESADEVRLSCRAVDTGEQSIVTARYAVGCDGATSFTRSAIASTWEHLAPSQRWLCVDVLEKRDLALPEALVFYCWTSRPHLYVPKGHGRHRWEYHAARGRRPRTSSPPARASGRSWIGTSRPRTSSSSAPRSTTSGRCWRRSGGAAVCSWQATPRTCSPRCTGRACAPASATRSTSAGSWGR